MPRHLNSGTNNHSNSGTYEPHSNYSNHTNTTYKQTYRNYSDYYDYNEQYRDRFAQIDEYLSIESMFPEDTTHMSPGEIMDNFTDEELKEIEKILSGEIVTNYKTRNVSDEVIIDPRYYQGRDNYNDYNYDDYYDYRCYSNYSNAYIRTYAQYAYADHSNHANSHTNNGYTNHINVNTNIEPNPPTYVNSQNLVYYKDTISLTIGSGSDEKKAITVRSGSLGADTTHLGIYEDSTLRVSASRSWMAAAWNSSGVYLGGDCWDVHDTNSDAIIAWINTVPNSAWLACGSYDDPLTGAAALHNKLASLGISPVGVEYRDSWAGIVQIGNPSSATTDHARYYGGHLSISSANKIINGKSPQVLGYDIEYNYRPVSAETPNGWKGIASYYTGLSYSYPLNNHGSGFIQFRIRTSDGIDVSGFTYSAIYRIVKYKPPIWINNNSITRDEFNQVIVELNNVNVEIGANNTITSVPIVGNIVLHGISNEISKNTKIISDVLSIPYTQTNKARGDIIYKADINTVKNFIDKI
ncbi:MAG: hypothetical protein ACRCZ9_08915 [Fusobacteriaceae bacterium]